MSRETCQVLYVKYNALRAPEYRITTELCEDAEGCFVRKRAGEEAARKHLENIHKNGIALQDYYRDIRVVPSEWREGALIFPYIKGQTLADLIDVRHFDRDRFIAQVNEALAAVFSVQDKYVVPFEMTEDFERVFGKVEIPETPALNPANIDSLLTNFARNDSGTYCFDCEWVCNFPVPIDFIKYRILLYLYVTQMHAQLNGASLEEMLGWFGFSPRDCAVYWEMDDRFEQRVHGEGRRYIYTERYRKKVLSIEALQQQIEDKETQIQTLTTAYQTISNSFFWRATKPARNLLDALKRFAKSNEFVYLSLRTARDVPRHGVRYALNRCRRYMKDRKRIRDAGRWPSAAERARQRRESFPKDITFSILVPLYNTPEKYLRPMIQSVLDQTYAKWELCLADGSDAEHSAVEKVCQEYAGADARIRYRKLKENLGISGNTNACIDMAMGNYIALFDHDDMLHPSALYENMKAICAQDADFVYSDENTFHETPSDAYYPHYKPDYAPDTLRSYNYICHLTVFRRSLLDEIGGGFRSQFDGSQDYDMILRLTEKARHIVHIPRILYFWRGHPGSVASDVGAKTYTIAAARAALDEHLDRIGLKGTVKDSAIPSTYKIQYVIEGAPLISIVIPNMDHVEDLKKCIDSISEKSTWRNWEIIVVENNSRDEETFEYYRLLEKRPEIRVVTWEGGFNFPAICNFGAKAAKGDYILLLNNDIQVITHDWLEQMLMFAQRADVGAVGAMLYYPDDTIQHAGVILGIGGVAGHSHKYFKRGDYGYASRLTIAQNLSAVTAACCLIPRRVWEEIDGLDEGYAVAFNDVDMCLRIRKAGYLIVWTPYAELYHFESKSRGYEDTPEKQKRFKREIDLFNDRWSGTLAEGDPYYNPNLTLEREDFSFR